jgi:methylase of polypeptide subunit release factors
MELFYTPASFHYNTVVTPLSTGHSLTYPSHLNGGGDSQWSAFHQAIKLYGKSSYNKGLEWCAGMGLLGFECLLNNICKEITFNDHYDLAVKSCIDSAKELNVDNRIKTHLSSTLADLPDNEIYDFIIGNPPHVFEKDQFVKSTREWAPDVSEASITQSCRMVLDSDGGIHKNFFENVRSHIHADTDIFLSGSITNIEQIKKMAQDSDLEIIHDHTVDIDWVHNHIKIYHLRSY